MYSGTSNVDAKLWRNRKNFCTSCSHTVRATECEPLPVVATDSKQVFKGPIETIRYAFREPFSWVRSVRHSVRPLVSVSEGLSCRVRLGKEKLGKKTLLRRERAENLRGTQQVFGLLYVFDIWQSIREATETWRNDRTSSIYVISRAGGSRKFAQFGC